MLRGLLLVSFFTALGEAFERLARLPLPGPVLGLVALLVALRAGLVPRAAIAEACGALTGRMALFIVPAAVAIFGPTSVELISTALVPVVVASVVSTLVVFAVVGLTAQRMARS